MTKPVGKKLWRTSNSHYETKFGICKDSTKIALDSGHHRCITLKELWEEDALPSDFKIPVYDLKRLCPMVRDQYKPNLEFALRYAVTGGTLGRDFALRVIAKSWFMRLCTGIDSTADQLL